MTTISLAIAIEEVEFDIKTVFPEEVMKKMYTWRVLTVDDNFTLQSLKSNVKIKTNFSLLKFKRLMLVRIF